MKLSAADDLYDVIEVQIRSPHSERVMATGKTRANAEAFIKIAIMRRGVENQFYTMRPTANGAHP